MKALSAFIAGALFSVGLAVSGMTLPENVVGFLDFFGDWRPALAFVMGGAVGVYAALYPLVIRRGAPLFAPAFDVPAPAPVDARLLAGAAAFGAGWGLAGFCPGPALTALGSGAVEAAIFTGAMTAGICLHRLSSGSAVSGSCG
ncbi:MAG: YeeE/YedE family protein [Elusimicrobia bacterium]|nr:YeeE/YedE family protein [Elusimicrobiota bacterium]